MNFRIALMVFAVASVITASTAIVAMSMQKAYSQVDRGEWCFKERNGKESCFANEATCDKEMDGKEVLGPCSRLR